MTIENNQQPEMETKGLEQMSQAESMAWLMQVLGDMPYCFCKVCYHQPSYGHCDKCRCGNHVPAKPKPSQGE
jgi:hypothetical protein